MNEEKPLHVQVAEALGWTEIRQEVWDIGGQKIGRDEWGGVLRDDSGKPTVWGRIARYDTDWSATGPLIERFRIDLFSRESAGVWTARAWVPNDDPVETLKRAGNEPLTAVCNLILALKAAGKLPGGELWGVSSLDTPEGKEAMRAHAKENIRISEEVDNRARSGRRFNPFEPFS